MRIIMNVDHSTSFSSTGLESSSVSASASLPTLSSPSALGVTCATPSRKRSREKSPSFQSSFRILYRCTVLRGGMVTDLVHKERNRRQFTKLSGQAVHLLLELLCIKDALQRHLHLVARSVSPFGCMHA